MTTSQTNYKLNEPTRLREDHFTIVVKVREFSEGHKLYHHALKLTDLVDYYISSDYIKVRFVPVRVYPNGRNVSTKGSISFDFLPKIPATESHHLIDDWIEPVRGYTNGQGSSTKKFASIVQAVPCWTGNHVEMSCVISVIDAEGNRRFSQSFFVFYNALEESEMEKNSFVVDEYISRAVLLKEPKEFLTNGTLSLHMDVVLKEHFTAYYDNVLLSEIPKMNFITEEGPDCLRYYLSLDSPLAKRLAEESLYFQRIMDTPMVEKSSRRMLIPNREYGSFITMGAIVFGYPVLGYESFADICCAYVVGQKYHVPTVVNTSKSLLNLFFTHEKAVWELLEFAIKFKIPILKEIVKDILQDESEDDDSGTMYQIQIPQMMMMKIKIGN